jgi:starch-binding outer membrane protein, SusD/RagB family
MPNVTSSADGYSSFRDLVWNERCVELCFEGKYWFDIRRWYVGHLPEYKSIVDLSFDKDWTSFSRSVVKERVFDDPKHYWMPLPREQTLLYKEYYQNPGW